MPKGTSSRFGSTTASAGTYSLTIDTTLLDRAGQALAAPLVLPFELEAGTLKLVLYEAPDPTLVSDSTVGNLFGFHGLERDPESGLYYARHRYYDPELGRFITPDPLGYADGPNAYQYAMNDPVNRTDPMGLQHDTQYPLWQAEQSMAGDAQPAGVPPSLASAAGYAVGIQQSGHEMAWFVVTMPVTVPVRHYRSLQRESGLSDRGVGPRRRRSVGELDGVA